MLCACENGFSVTAVISSLRKSSKNSAEEKWSANFGPNVADEVETSTHTNRPVAISAQADLCQRVFAESFWSGMPSTIDACKRALVTLLRKLAAKYNLTLNVARESSDSDVKAAFKRVRAVIKKKGAAIRG